MSDEELRLAEFVSDEFDEPEADLDLYDDEILIPEDAMLNQNRAAVPSRKWPKYGEYVIIPYVISNGFYKFERDIITKGIKRFHDRTCIRFIDKEKVPSLPGFIHIFKGPRGKCSSAVGNYNQ